MRNLRQKIASFSERGKRVTFGPFDQDGNPYCVPLFSKSLEKTAAEKVDNLHPAVRKFVDKVKPTPKGIYVLVNAMGASEIWGQNSNGDVFTEDELNHAPEGWDNLSPEEMKRVGATWDYGYPTFMNAHPFMHHQNKDPSRAFGEVLIAVWNKRMHRVELVVFLDRELCRKFGAEEVLNRIEAGEFPSVSMGTKVPYDVCTKCGNKARVVSEYCICLKLMRGRIMDDGVQVGMYNPKPRFFDISFVFRGADKTAKVLLKIASAKMVKMASEKRGSIKKHIEEDKFTRAALDKVERHEHDIPKHVLNRMGKLPLKESLSTSGMAGIVLKPREFQRVILVHIGQKPLADAYESHNCCFPETDDIDESLQIDKNLVNHDLLGMLGESGLLHARSIAGPSLSHRIHAAKRHHSPAPKKEKRDIETPLLKKISAAYNGYRKGLVKHAMQIQSFLLSDPTVNSSFKGEQLTSVFAGGLEKVGASGMVPESLVYLEGAHFNNRALILDAKEHRRVQAQMGFGL